MVIIITKNKYEKTKLIVCEATGFIGKNIFFSKKSNINWDSSKPSGDKIKLMSTENANKYGFFYNNRY